MPREGSERQVGDPYSEGAPAPRGGWGGFLPEVEVDTPHKTAGVFGKLDCGLVGFQKALRVWH